MKKVNIKEKWQQQSILKKILVTFLIVGVYLLGRHILVLGAPPIEELMSSTNQLEGLVMAFTGMDMSQVSIFSLGLGPYMTATIIWRLVSMNKRWNLKNWSIEKSDVVQKLLMLIFAVFQSFSVLRMIQFEGIAQHFNMSPLLLAIVVMLVVVTGVFLVVWLAAMNEEYGIGGQTIIVIISILLNLNSSVLRFILFYSTQDEAWIVYTLTTFVCVALIFIHVLIEKAEIRLPLNRMMTESQYADKSYLPIKYTPAGGMPLMYASSVLVLLSLIMDMLRPYIQININLMDWTNPISLSVYLVTVYLLALLFAYINLEPEETAKGLQRSGEYFDYIQPGKKTLKYLKYFISRQAHIGARYLVIMIGAPYIINFFWPLPQFLMTLPVTVIIAVGLIIAVVEEIDILRIGSWYDKDFRKESMY